MIQIVIEMEENGSMLNIKAQVPPPIVLAVVTAAYHEMLSQKIRADFDSSVRLATRLPKNGG
jgi:hypothetical protein